jgi:hypothetical protein
MTLALCFGILNQRILVKPFTMPENRSGNLDRDIRCKHANDIERGVGKPGNPASEPGAGGALDIFEQLPMTLSNNST